MRLKVLWTWSLQVVQSSQPLKPGNFVLNPRLHFLNAMSKSAVGTSGAMAPLEVLAEFRLVERLLLFLSMDKIAVFSVDAIADLPEFAHGRLEDLSCREGTVQLIFCFKRHRLSSFWITNPRIMAQRTFAQAWWPTRNNEGCRRKSIPKANGLINIDTWGFFRSSWGPVPQKKAAGKLEFLGDWNIYIIYNIYI